METTVKRGTSPPGATRYECSAGWRGRTHLATHCEHTLGTPTPQRICELEEVSLPPVIVEATGGQEVAPFGIAIVQTKDARLATETCEELYTVQSPHILFALNGVDIVSNGSGSHHQLRKLHYRVDNIKSATGKAGGVYLYANQHGGDGNRVYFDGCASVFVNGEVVAQGTQFSVADVEVVTAVVDLNEVRSLRASLTSHGTQSQASRRLPIVRAPLTLRCDKLCLPTPSRALTVHSPQEEIGYGPACWLWDYLRRSGANGYFLPLSGGADSSATAAIVGIMCHKVYRAIMAGNARVLADARRVVGEEPVPKEVAEAGCSGATAAAAAGAVCVRGPPRHMTLTAAGGGMHLPLARLDDGGWVPSSPADLAHRLFHTTYMGTANSSAATRGRAAALAKEIGAYHVDMNIDAVVAAMLTVFAALFGKTPAFLSAGGSWAEDLALQNIQARLRMVWAYLLAQLLLWVRGRSGFLLVLGSANVDEALRGYMTKYDCSAADINPIGGVAKGDLKQFLGWAGKEYPYPSLLEVVAAPPTAELRPTSGQGEHTQTDEEDMGMSYAELGAFGRLRKVHRCGPLTMYQRLLVEWVPQRGLTPQEVGEKVKRFFRYYAINRHKMTVLTPSYHAESYSPDDNRFDHRPFLYPVGWTAQFRAIDEDVKARGTPAPDATATVEGGGEGDGASQGPAKRRRQ